MLLLILFLLFFNIFSVYSEESAEKEELKDPFATEEPVTEDDVAFPEDPMTNFWDDELEAEQEASTRFYEYGRFIHIMGFVELSIPTGPRAYIYTAGPIVGGKFSYFIDWNVAIILSLGLGFIPINCEMGTTTYTGVSNVFDMSMGVKYYLNFNDISSLISAVNPYLVVSGGLFAVKDSLSELPISTGTSGTSLVTPPEYKDLGVSVYMALGMEFYIFHRDILLGFEMGYRFLVLPEFDDPTATYDYSGNATALTVNLIWDM